MSKDLVEFVSQYERIWNRHDSDALAALYTPDADMIVGADPTVQGRAAIAAWWQTYFSRLDRGRRGAFSIASARLVAGDVAIVTVHSTTLGRGDQGQGVLPTRLARGTWVVVRQGQGWAIAALRAQPAEGESRTRAGTDTP